MNARDVFDSACVLLLVAVLTGCVAVSWGIFWLSALQDISVMPWHHASPTLRLLPLWDWQEA